MNRYVSVPRRRAGLWFSRIEPDSAQLAAASNLLAPEEHARAGRFKREPDRIEYILARAALRRLLGRDLARHPAELAFGSSAAGKPLLLAPEADLHFSVSHCRGGLLIAWCVGREVGVDLEWIDPARVNPGIARRVFSPSQVRRLERANDTERVRLFYRYWTRLEAAAKATGIGVARFQIAPERLKVRSFSPAAGYMGAVAFAV